MSAEQKLVKLTIDGRETEVPAGTLIIRAAEGLGIYIPRFCDHPLLDPLGACRQCLVEVEGQRKQLTACTTTVSEGMVVKTQASSVAAADAQEAVLEFLLVNHPLDCPMCDKGGECPLQDQTLRYGPGESRYIDAKRHYTKPVPVNPLVKLDRERCVLCARCTRFASQIAGEPLIEFFERGAHEQVAIFEEKPFASVFSGNVAQICPVGALTSSTFRFRARPFDMTATPSTCNRCASGCSICVNERRGDVVRVLATMNLDVNDDWICDKGRYGYEYVASPERVTEPLVRKDGEFVAVSWAEALATVADRVRQARETGARTAVLGGAQLADEDSYALSRFARVVLGTNDVDARLRAGSEEEDAVLSAVVRSRTATNADIDRARVVVVAGLDAREESPIVFLRLRKALRKNGARVVVVGPVRSALSRSGASWIPAAAGEEASAIAGLVSTLGDARGSVVVLAGERLAASPGALTAAWNLAVDLDGKFGWVPRKAGARGALQAGLHPAMLPGGREVSNPADREAVEAVWGAAVPEAPGRDARAILAGASEIGVLVCAGVDPARDFAGTALGAAGIDAAGFVVAFDLFLTETARRADVVLPAAAAYERAGSLTNWEGRAQELRAVVSPAGSSQTDIEILAALAAELGAEFPGTIEELQSEMRALARDVVASVALPAVAPQAAGPADGFALVTYPLLLDAGTMMSGAGALGETAELPFAALNPEDAVARGIASGDEVRVATEHAEVRVVARIDDGVARGTVFVPARQTGAETGALLRDGSLIGIVSVEAVK